MELSTRQLAKIKVYVAGGWKYPDTQLAVTHHIKYRVQDLMTDDLNLHLDDAITIAHTEFGKQSFKVFEDCIKAAAKNKYGKLIWQTLPTNFIGKYLIAGISMMLWSYLFFADVRPLKLSFILPIILINFPHSLIFWSMPFTPAKRYKLYNNLHSCNAVMSPWGFVLGAIMMATWCCLDMVFNGQNAILCGILLGIILYTGFITVRTGCIVRCAAIQDCKEIEAQLNEM